MQTYTIEAGRLILCDGIPQCTIHRVGNDSEGYTISPADADALARRIVDALNCSEIAASEFAIR